MSSGERKTWVEGDGPDTVSVVLSVVFDGWW